MNEEIYTRCLPKTFYWKEKLNEINNIAAPFVKYYFRNSSFDNYPVVGVSYK